METVHSGDKVKAGVYVAVRALDVQHVGAEGETLQGKAGATYRRVPTTLLLLGGPVLGGLFVLLFPAVVAVAILIALAQLAGKWTAPRGSGTVIPRGAGKVILGALLVGACALALPALVHVAVAVFAVEPFPQAQGTQMHTLYDFITHIKGVEYLMALGAIAAFLLSWELLKPEPFGWMRKAGHDDAEFVKERGGARFALRNVGRIAAAPFIGAAYVAMVPALIAAAVTLGAAQLAFQGARRAAGLVGMRWPDWRPMDAYFPRHA
jgi:hypothetical protein